MFPVSHKTVFVLDESADFVRTSIGEPVDLGKPGLPLLNKSLWTSSIESITEYCRIVWDIFPDGQRVISFARSRPKSRPLLTWDQDDQSLPSLMKSLIPMSREVHAESQPRDLLIGLRSAVSILTTETPYQMKFKGDKLKLKHPQTGRIVCLSYFRSQEEVNLIQEQVASIVTEQGLQSVDLVLLNTFPMNRPPNVGSVRSATRVSDQVTSVVESSPAGIPLSCKVLSLVLAHYDLASTTVTGIPMKEEQNSASSSANYDVEIVHPKIVHSDLFRDTFKVAKEGCEYDSIPLKWVTPRTAAQAEITFTTNAVRVTPVDVNSRPSSCLTNFLLSGRTVMLEMPKKKSVISHMLCCHDHELYIHGLTLSRTILEDPPSISEGTGGRVTDYRINDFGMLMKLNKLVRCRHDSQSSVISPAMRCQQYLTRQTSYWPLTFSNSLIFSVQPQLQDLLDLIPKESLTPEDVTACKNALYDLVKMESKGLPLPVIPGTLSSSSSSKSGSKSGPRREEQYRGLFKELAHFVSVHATTPEHRTVLHSLVNMTNIDIDESMYIPTPPIATTTSLGLQPSLASTSASAEPMNVDSLPASSTSSTQVTDSSRAQVKEESSNGIKRSNTASDVQDWAPVPQESLLSFWKRKVVRKQDSTGHEFEGRINNLPLYYHMTQRQQERSGV